MSVVSTSKKWPEGPRKLAKEILYLASREGQSKGGQLRVAGLAEQLNVSRTPVDAALKHLVDEGFVEHRRNRGYFLVRPALEAELNFNKTGREDSLKLKFAQDAFNRGDGSTVSVSNLIKAYSISRTQAQQLVDTASGQGWLEKSAGHNWVVRLGIVTEQDYSRFYRFRQALEPAALREPGFSPDRAELERLERIQLQLSGGDFSNLSAIDLFEINRDFHETVIGWSGNRFYLDALKHSNDLRRLMEYSKVMKTEKIDSFAKEHLGILKAIRTGDLELAEKRLSQHLKRATLAKT